MRRTEFSSYSIGALHTANHTWDFTASKGPVINSSRGGGGRHLGGRDQNPAHSEGKGLKNKEHFRRRTMELVLRS